MTSAGDYHDEMRKPRPLRDREVEDFFAGRPLPGEDLLNSFAHSVRASSTGPAPMVKGDLARILVDGLTIDKGDLSATAASKAAGPRTEASGLPKWRRPVVATSTFLTAIFTKVGMASAAAKVGLTAAVAAGALTAAGAAGALPGPVQNAVSHAISDISPINLPTTATPSHGKPTTPGVNGLNQANTTPAAGHAPTSLPAPTGQAGPPASPGSQSSTGLTQATSTPAAGHAPTSLPTPTNPGSQSTSHPSAPTNTAPPASPGTQSTTGLNQTSSTPAAGQTPSSVPAPTTMPAGGPSTGTSTAGSHTGSTPTKP
jgi:hypothetical protein